METEQGKVVGSYLVLNVYPETAVRERRQGKPLTGGLGKPFGLPGERPEIGLQAGSMNSVKRRPATGFSRLQPERFLREPAEG